MTQRESFKGFGVARCKESVQVGFKFPIKEEKSWKKYSSLKFTFVKEKLARKLNKFIKNIGPLHL